MHRIGQSAGKSFAYILGVYLGDGCVSKINDGRNEVFRLNTIDRDFAEATKAALIECECKTVTICTYAVKKSTKPNHSLTSRVEPLTAALVELTNGKKRLPDMSDWDRSMKLAFIGGLMDSEGYVAENRNVTNRRFYMGYKSCDSWVPDFIRLLESVGIKIGKIGIEKPYKPGYKIPMRFTIKMQSWIESGARFNIARKQNRVEEWASAGAYENRSRYPRRLTSETTRRAAAKPMI